MNNATMDEWRRRWFSDADEEAVEALLSTAMGAAYREARYHLSHEEAEDISTRAARYLWSIIDDVTDFVTTTDRITWRLVKRRQRAIHRDMMKRKEYKTMIDGRTRRASEERRGEVRDLVVDTLTPREWQVVHGFYWSCTPAVELAKRCSMSRATVYRVRDTALEQLRITLHSMGVTANNWSRWYNEV